MAPAGNGEYDALLGGDWADCGEPPGSPKDDRPYPPGLAASDLLRTVSAECMLSDSPSPMGSWLWGSSWFVADDSGRGPLPLVSVGDGGSIGV
jgi:hypothetical protein